MPSPMSGIDLAIANISNNKWPVIIPNLEYKGRAGTIDKLWVMHKDGTITDAPLPVIDGIKFKYYPHSLFHDEEFIYYFNTSLKLFSKKGYGRLFRFKIGKNKAKLIFAFKERERYDLKFLDGKYVVLSGPNIKLVKGPITKLLKLPEGDIIPNSEFSNDLGTDLWKKINNIKYSKNELPITGLPENFRKYSKYNFQMNSFKKINTLSTRTYLGTKILSVWGFHGGAENYGDIALKPAFLKDKSAVLVGVNIPTNEVIFYVPIIRIKGIYANSESPVGRLFPFKVININEKESLLIVMESLNNLKYYKLNRPMIN